MNYGEELDLAKRLARESGEILLELRSSDLKVTRKNDARRTLVSTADEEVSKFLSAELQREFPDYKILDEEQAQHPAWVNAEKCWVIDPLDNTKGYLQGDEHFSVLIGLLHNQQPVLGVTYRPIADELTYSMGDGFYIEQGEGPELARVNSSSELHVLVSGSQQNEELDDILRKLNPDSVRRISGSIKTIEVALGRATAFICPISFEMHHWDYCAPIANLEAAGGRASYLDGSPYDFGQLETVNRRGFLATNGVVHETVLERLRK
tara:strand:+ start:5891 stop:6685 length:795 start_codon:yes stop_codon:yes gene_type:complete